MAPRSWPGAGFEAQFDPEAQGIPTGSSLLGRQVGEDDPGFFLLDVPDDQQGAAAFGSGGAEGGAATDPRGVGTGNEVLSGQPAASLGAEGDAFRIPHVGMPAPDHDRGLALSAYLLPQFRTGQAPVAQHDHGHFLWNRRGQFPQQFHYRVHPGAALDAPGHGNGATPVNHADDDGGGLVAFQSGVNRQGQPTGPPPGEHPPEQGRKAETHVQFGPAGAGPVAAVVEPLPEILAEVVPSAPGRECGGHGVLAGAAGENGPTHPLDQAGQLWSGEVR